MSFTFINDSNMSIQYLVSFQFIDCVRKKKLINFSADRNKRALERLNKRNNGVPCESPRQTNIRDLFFAYFFNIEPI